jgi:hypothetical protein
MMMSATVRVYACPGCCNCQNDRSGICLLVTPNDSSAFAAWFKPPLVSFHPTLWRNKRVTMHCTAGAEAGDTSAVLRPRLGRHNHLLMIDKISQLMVDGWGGAQ